MKKVLGILFWSILLAGIGVAVVFMQMKHKETICQGFTLSIIDNNPDPLISEADIRQQILQITDTLTGKKIGEIDLMQIHGILKDNPYILNTDIQSDISGNLSVEIELRRAILRVINKDGYSYYIDEDGYLLPVNPGYPSRVLIANGNIKDGIKDLNGSRAHLSQQNNTPIIEELYELASYIYWSPFLSKMISQVWVNEKGAYELIPLVGNYTVKFGGIEEFPKKFEKLETFYREGAGKAGWIDYRSVDLRYKNQIICSKK